MDHQPKFFENLSGTGKAIGVLTSGGDAQAVFARPSRRTQTLSSVPPFLLAFPGAWPPPSLAGQRIEALRELSPPKCLHVGKWWGADGWWELEEPASLLPALASSASRCALAPGAPSSSYP